MALEVEDGTGKANADSYASVVEADTYLAARNYTSWAALAADVKDACLRKATEYMSIYAWKGARVTATQALDWPRSDVWAYGFELSSDAIPGKVVNACIELAYRASTADLFPVIRVDSTGRLPTKEIKKVGPIDRETTYSQRGQMAEPRNNSFPAVDAMLREFVASAGSTYR
jgi:hypothetical protein